MNREKIIIRTSIQGIIVNLLLVIAKAIVGLIAGSVSIILDAVNNTTDMLSSVVTIIGTKLAGRAPDREHPYGHGRIEYLTSMAVGIIILAAGVTALIEAVPKIFHPEVADYSIATVIVVILGVLVKFVFGRYVKGVGEKIQSGSLRASGLDAIFDSVLSFGTLVGVVVSLIWDISIDGWIGSAIALFIVKASIEILKDGWLDLIGRRVDSELSRQIKDRVSRFPEVSGAYDLVLHNYGPTQVIGSVHIQVPDKITAKELHHLTRKISTEIYKEFRVLLTIGIYAENDSDKEGLQIKQALNSIISEHPEVLQMHGFYFDRATKVVAFDIIIDYKHKNRLQIKNKIVRHLRKQFPDYKYNVIIDADISD